VDDQPTKVVTQNMSRLVMNCTHLQEWQYENAPESFDSPTEFRSAAALRFQQQARLCIRIQTHTHTHKKFNSLNFHDAKEIQRQLRTIVFQEAETFGSSVTARNKIKVRTISQHTPTTRSFQRTHPGSSDRSMDLIAPNGENVWRISSSLSS
jgi:hypothetical protein